MKAHYLPLALIAGLVMQLTPTAAATPTALRSPKIAHTYADSSILWHQLRWLPASRELVATVTFSNLDYVSRVEPRHDETFNFPLPGVTYSAKDGTFYSSTGVPVATLHPDLIGRSISLVPTARVRVSNRGGRVALHLLANQPRTDGPLWVEE